MKRSLQSLSTAFLAGLLAVPATGGESSKTEAKNRQLMHAYAACVVKSHRAAASDAILANSNNAEILKEYSQLISSDCLRKTAGNVKMTFQADLFRYALADALVSDGPGVSPVVDFNDRLPLAHLPAPSKERLDAEIAATKSKRRHVELNDGFSKAASVAWLSRYGECVVRRAPGDARFWLLTPPGGPEEVSRINALRPAFAGCLGDGTLKFGRIPLRGTVAINYYRLAMATPVAGKAR